MGIKGTKKVKNPKTKKEKKDFRFPNEVPQLCRNEKQGIRELLVIGGGASGLLAAIFAARAGVQVSILEHKEQLGKKILSTGNGRCNLGNRRMDEACYYAGEQEFPWQVFSRFGLEESEAFWQDLGLVLRDKNGYLYPWSESAAVVTELLDREIEALGVEVRLGCHVTACVREKAGGLWKVKSEQGDFLAKRVVLASGSKAASVLGSDGSGYAIAESLGHQVLPVLPALVQLRCQGTFFKAWSGVRVQARVSLYLEGQLAAKDCGEVQLTDYGISGIPVFQVSRFASRGLYEGKKVEVLLDFLAFLKPEEERKWFEKRLQSLEKQSANIFLAGFLQKKLATVLLKSAGIIGESRLCDLTEAQKNKLFLVLTAFRLTVLQTNSFEQAQICTGGVDVGEIDAATMESKLAAGLYLTGELLDVDGICGGYNLQWAFSSGAVAGKAAAASLKRSTEKANKLKNKQ